MSLFGNLFRNLLHRPAPAEGAASAVKGRGAPPALTLLQTLRDRVGRARDPERILVEAERLCSEGRYAEADARCASLLERDPDCAQATHRRGVIALHGGRYAEAARYLGQARDARAGDPRFHYDLGETYRLLGQWQQAADTFRRALVLQPNFHEARVAQAECCLTLGQIDQAAQGCNAVLAAEPDNPRAVLLAAQLAVRRGASSEAETWFRKALQCAPDDPALLEALAGALLDQGRTEAAEPILRRALRLAPARAELQRNVVRHIAHEIDRQADPKDAAGASAGEAAAVPLLSPNAANTPIGPASPVSPLAIQAGTPRLSVVICSIDRKKFDTVTAAYAQLLAGVPHEIIGIHDARSLCEGYNRGINRSRGESILFSHDDIEILTPDFAVRLMAHLGKHDIIGACGTTRVTDGLWIEACWPHVQGLLAHGYPQGAPDAGRYRVMVFDSSAEDSTGLLQALDGMFLGVNREVLDRRRFDAETFDGFHLYDIDFTFGAYLDGFDVAVFRDITMVHHTDGASPGYSEAFARYRLRFHDKYRKELSGTEALNPSRIRFIPALFDTTDQVRRFCERLLQFRRGEIARSAQG